ncbi:MAG TPA: hypothetical protein VGH91_01670 [Gammaproteobacteria bacterium]|jgi:hypothetical protein
MYARKHSSWDSGVWHPDVRASLSGAVAAALLVMVGFAALFSAVPPLKLSQAVPEVREELVLAEPTPVPPRPRPRAHIARPLLPVQLPELQRMPPPVLAPPQAPDSISLQDYLDERAKENTAALEDQVTGSDLRRELGKPTEKQALPDDQSYQTIDGQKVVRSGGRCAQIQTVQGSSSPTNHVDIAEPTDCPGGAPDASQQMGKALGDWAEKHRVPPPPPR